MGIHQAEVETRLQEIIRFYFYGEEQERVYYPVGEDMAYIMDTGNLDVRTEGMSYGMMLCVQLDMKKEFDCLWKWAKTYMYMAEGENEGYFAWSCAIDGTKNAYGPAPDGEEFFAMALFFASHRWGDGEGIYAYEKEARAILRACLHKGSEGRQGAPMWNLQNHQILFVPGIDFTDPSYHCHISMNCSVSGRMRKTGISGRRQQWQAVNIWCRHARPSQVCPQNMQSLMVVL